MEHMKKRKGYVISLNTFSRRFTNTRDDVDTYCKQIRALSEQDGEQVPYSTTALTYGLFDRMSVESVECFSRFFGIPGRTSTWLGKHHSVYLYTISDDSKLRVEPFKDDPISTENPEESFGFKVNGERCTHLYSALSLFALSSKMVEHINDYSTFLQQLRNEILNLVDKIKERSTEEGKILGNIECEVYGCFNTSEVAILWVADQYCDILQLNSLLNQLSIEICEPEVPEYSETPNVKQDSTPSSVFFNVFSVFSRNMDNERFYYGKNGVANIEDVRDKIDIRGVAIVQFSVNHENRQSAMEKVSEALKDTLSREEGVASKVEIIYGAGEYDVTVKMPAKYTYDLFSSDRKSKDKSLFHFDGELLKDILKTTVYLGITEEECNIKLRDYIKKTSTRIINVDGDGLTEWGLSKEEVRPQNALSLMKELDPCSNSNGNKIKDYSLYHIYSEIRGELEKMDGNSTGAIDTLDLLYRDYLSNIHECYNTQWRNDFHYQFKKTMEFILQLSNMCQQIQKARLGSNYTYSIETDFFWPNFEKSINDLRQQILHLSQSTRMFLRVPASNIRYTGNMDLLFHGCYGITKEILEYAYKIAKDDQSELIPLITANVLPHVSSVINSIPSSVLADKYQDDFRIMRIGIPNALLTEPDREYYYLVHELFHYIAPKNRIERNSAIDSLILNELISASVTEYIRKCVLDKVTAMDDTDEMKKLMSSEVFSDCLFNELSIDIRSCVNNALNTTPSTCPRTLDLIAQIKKELSLSDHLAVENRLFHKHVENLAAEYTCVDRSGALRSVLFEIGQVILAPNTNSFRSKFDPSESFSNNMYDEQRKQLAIGYGFVAEYLPKFFSDDYMDQKKYYCCTTDNIQATQDAFINGIREAVPDIAMCQICNMDEIEYLMHYVRNQEDLFADKKLFPECDVLRLFSVIDFLAHFKSVRSSETRCSLDTKKNYFSETLSSAQTRKDFVARYLAEFTPVTKMLNKAYIQEQIARANNWIEIFRKKANQYIRQYHSIRQGLLTFYLYYAPFTRDREEDRPDVTYLANCSSLKLKYGRQLQNCAEAEDIIMVPLSRPLSQNLS